MYIVLQPISCKMKPRKVHVTTNRNKDLSHDLIQNNELAFSSTTKVWFYRFQMLELSFFQFSLLFYRQTKSSVESSREDQTWLTSRKGCWLVFVSHAVQKVLLQCSCLRDWWFSIHTFFSWETFIRQIKWAPFSSWREGIDDETCTIINFDYLQLLLALFWIQ